MFIASIFKFCLFIQIVHSFRTPKHNLITYYKAQDSVYLTNPLNDTTDYGIYVAGHTIYMHLPKQAVQTSQMLYWKVINSKEDRLMFVHNYEPQILIDGWTIKQMKFSGKLTGSIIALGDNEALHVPTIDNINARKPYRRWNYLELLYFDVSAESVSIIKSLPWLKDDDWKYIKRWEMTDYIHFDDKLYLLIIHSTTSAVGVSIIRLCLDKGTDLIDTAVEVHFTRPEFQDNDSLLKAIFVLSTGPLTNESRRYSLLMQIRSIYRITYTRYYIDNFVSLFDQVAKDCASGASNVTLTSNVTLASNVTLLRHFLRSENGECKQTVYKSCTPNENIIPSFNLTEIDSQPFDQFYKCLSSLLVGIPNIESISIPYPYHLTFIFHTNMVISSTFAIMIYENEYECQNFYKIDTPGGYIRRHVFLNQQPPGFAYINEVLFQEVNVAVTVFSPCGVIKTCMLCSLYALQFTCAWRFSKCVAEKPLSLKLELSNNCFQVESISPLIMNSTPKETLTIQFDTPLELTSHESLVIKAGANNYCTDIQLLGKYLNCTLNLIESGEFVVDVMITSEKYVDANTLYLFNSLYKLFIDAPQVERKVDSHLIMLYTLIATSLISSLLVMIYYRSNLRRFTKCFFRKKRKVTKVRPIKRRPKSQSKVKSPVKPKVSGVMKNQYSTGNFSRYFQ